MASTTGIELGPDSCVLAAVRPARGAVRVSALHVIEPSQWPAEAVTVAAELDEARRTKRFPRRARVIAWGLPEGTMPRDAAALTLLRPLTTAGFHVDAIMTPPQALALLAASRPRSAGAGAVAWMALNTHGAAIAIVRGTELLFSRTFDWHYDIVSGSSNAQMLQRYSMVARLAPEVRNGIAMVRTSHGAIVDTAVTCGDLPELRSLTMPLIEELDLEVETLDSTEGLMAVGTARAERFAESAPAIRLACAVAAARIKRPAAARQLAAAAAVIAIVAALGWGGYRYWIGGTTPVPAPRNAAVVKPGPATSTAASGRSRGTLPVTPPAGGKPAAPPVAAPPAPAPTAAQNRPSSPSGVPAAPPPASVASAPVAGIPAAQQTRRGGTDIPGASLPAKPSPGAQAPVSQVTRAEARPNLPSASPKLQTAPAAPPQKPAPRAQAEPAASKPSPPSTTPAATTSSAGKRQVPTTPPEQTAMKAAPVLPPTVQPPDRRVDAPGAVKPAPAVKPADATPAPAVSESRRPDVTGAPRATDVPVLQSSPPIAKPLEAAPPAVAFAPPGRGVRASRQVPLKQPLPRVDSILIDQERRLAIVDGEIVKVGDTVGPRVVTLIDADGIVLREPSGLTVRVSLRGKGPNGQG